MHLAFEVADDHCAADDQQPRQIAVQQLFCVPRQVAGGGAPGGDAAAAVGAGNEFGIGADGLRAADVLRPQQGARLRIGATHRRLERARADHVTRAGRRANQIGHTLDFIRAARVGQRHFPTHAALQRIDPGQALALSHQQRVLERADNARLRQRQRLAGTPQVPEIAAVLHIVGLHRAIDAHHEDALAGHQRRGGDERAQASAPLHGALVEHHQFVVARHHRGISAITADAGRQPRTGAAAPEFAAAVLGQRDNAAVTAGDDEGIVLDRRHQHERRGLDARIPHRAPGDLRRDRLQRRRLGLVARTRDQRRAQAQQQGRAARPTHLAAPPAVTATVSAAGAAPSAVSLASTSVRYSVFASIALYAA